MITSREAINHASDKADANIWALSHYGIQEPWGSASMAQSEQWPIENCTTDRLTGLEDGRLMRRRHLNPWAPGSNTLPTVETSRQYGSNKAKQHSNRITHDVTRANNNFHLDVDDPKHPQFNAERYFNPYVKKYKCPKCKCVFPPRNKSPRWRYDRIQS